MPTGKRSAEDHRVLAFKIHRTGGNISAFMVTKVYAHILDEDRKVNAQKFESAF